MEDKLNNKKAEIKGIIKEVISAVIICILPIFFLCVLNISFNGAFKRYWHIALGNEDIVVEIIIIYAIYLLLCAIFKKAKNAVTVLGLLIGVFNIVNLMKFAFTGDPVLLADALYLTDSGEILGIVNTGFFDTIRPYLIAMIVEIEIFLILIAIGRYAGGNMRIEKIKYRIAVGLTSLLILIILFSPIKGLNDFILRNVYKIDTRTDHGALISIAYYYINHGVISGMYGQMLEDRIREPEDYDENIINTALNDVKTNENKILKESNIIVVFSESFWNIGQLEEVKFNKTVAPNFEKLKEKGLFFNMIAPVYGGISANTEYEFLTGSNTVYFNHGYVPYMQLYTNDSYYNRPSIIKELKNNGYKTKIATCASDDLFKCGRFYKYVKVDETNYITAKDVDEKDMKGNNISDRYITDRIIQEFNKKDKNQKLFYMTMTMQGHMPYNKDKYDNYDVWVEKSNLSNRLNETLTAYAQGVYDADKELGRLYDYIQTLDEPTIIVFYGDHLPYLYSGEENALEVLNYFNTKDENLNNYRKYNTQSLIVANYDIPKDEKTKYLGPDLLSAYILNNMDLEVSNYYKWLYESRKTIGATNFLVTADEEGNLYRTKALSGKLKEIYDLRRNIEYKLFVK